jgi:hypothetical protein
VSGDPNTTNLTVDPASVKPGGGQAGPAPTETVGHGDQTSSHPPGSAMPEGGIPFTERPEALVGAAFAGGLVLALILKRLGR